MLQQQAENLWTADHELKMPMGVRFPTRMTVVRLADRSLALISPVPIDEALAAELSALGSVSHLVAPNLLHHLHLAPAKARYREARVLGPEGLGAKRPELKIESLGSAEIPAFQGALEALRIEGAPAISETVWLHAPSRTAIVTELVFNVQNPPCWQTSLLLRTTDTRGKLAQSRVWSLVTKNKASAVASCARIFDWDFDRLVVAHGDVIATGAKERLAAALTRTPVPMRAA
jgi:hypothetical protein